MTTTAFKRQRTMLSQHLALLVAIATVAWIIVTQQVALADEAAEREPAISENEREHWSFKPLANPELPQNQELGWARNTIDHFILARLEKVGLTPASPTDRVTLIRRVTLDL